MIAIGDRKATIEIAIFFQMAIEIAIAILNLIKIEIEIAIAIFAIGVIPWRISKKATPYIFMSCLSECHTGYKISGFAFTSPIFHCINYYSLLISYAFFITKCTLAIAQSMSPFLLFSFAVMRPL